MDLVNPGGHAAVNADNSLSFQSTLLQSVNHAYEFRWMPSVQKRECAKRT
jgi:hypothetical protein